MVRGGFRRKTSEDNSSEFAYAYSNADLSRIVKTLPLADFVTAQALKYVAHICRRPSSNITKRALFAVPSRKYYRDPWKRIAEDLGVDISQAKAATQEREKFNRLLYQRFPNLKKADTAPNQLDSKSRT